MSLRNWIFAGLSALAIGTPACDEASRTVNYQVPPSLEAIVEQPEFDLNTERYRVVRGSDWLPSRAIGHIGSIPAKLVLGDARTGFGIDQERTKYIVRTLEEHPELEDITVRINHSAVIEDTMRNFTDERITESFSLPVRLLFGVPTTFFGEMFSELTRKDYYNPYTKTAILYSNLEGVAAHELGHHIDYSQFEHEWLYALSTTIPGMKIQHEINASMNARDLLQDGPQHHFARYLIPAFLTYVAGTGMLASSRIKKHRAKSIGYNDWKEVPELLKEPPTIGESLTLSGIWMLEHTAGLIGYAALRGAGELPGMAGYVAAYTGARMLSNPKREEIKNAPVMDRRKLLLEKIARFGNTRGSFFEND